MSTRTARIIRMRRHHRQKRKGNANRILVWFGATFSMLLSLIVVAALTAVGIGVSTYLFYASELPPPAQIESVQDRAFETSILYDRSGQNVIYEVVPPSEGDRQSVSIYDVPQHFIDATIAIEDASYYENPGFDIRGISRALWANFTGGDIQGGSTITQQLVKNVLIEEDERAELSVDRKISEIILASEISRLYSKDQILEWYVNTNFYGNLAYGIEAASRVYFNKSARNLSLAEAAMLAAIPQFPAQNPIDNPDTARLRQTLVLNRMVTLGYITQAEADAALAEPLIIRPFDDRFDIIAPHFSLYARSEAESILNQQGLDGGYLISRGGIRIYTTLDLDLQAQLECVARTHVERLNGANADFVHNTNTGGPCVAANELPPLSPDLIGGQRTVTNAAGVIMRAETGEIRAMLGSVDFWDAGIDGNFNVATGNRQPGSVFKPIVYLTAFLTPIDSTTIVTPATMLTDVRLEFSDGFGEPYVPLNNDRQFHGPVSVREALANSYNVPVVQVLNQIGLSPVIRTAHRMGINTLNESISAYGLSLALGAAEVSLVDMTYVYNVLNTEGFGVGTPVPANQARQGFRQLNPVTVLRIENADGDTLWEYSEALGTFDRRLIVPQGMAYIMTDILSDTEARLDAFGAGNPLELSRPAAAKTGTTDDNRDSWTMGYTPQYTTGIWVGNTDNTSMTDVSGITGAAPIWHAIMEYAHLRDDLPAETWERPNTVVEQTVCLWSGLLPTQNCSQIPQELFYVDLANGVDYRPQRQDDMWYRLPIDVCNNTRANDTTPPQCVTERLFFDFPPELMEWAQANTPELLPPEAEGFIREGSQFSPVAIVTPRFPDHVSGQVTIMGNTDIEDLAYFQLGYGAGNEPANFIQIGENGSLSEFNHELGVWDTSNLDDGVYTLQLQVINNDNRVESISTRVTVDNTTPEIRLITPLEAETISIQNDVVMDIEAEIFDSGDIDRVIFYITDAQTGEPVEVGQSNAFPYSLIWPLDDVGLRTVWAEVYDRAGNLAESNRVVVNIVE